MDMGQQIVSGLRVAVDGAVHQSTDHRGFVVTHRTMVP